MEYRNKQQRYNEGKQYNMRKYTSKENKSDTNEIFVGGKHLMSYVSAVITKFMEKNDKEVIIKSRGRFINNAIDVAEVSTKRYLNNEIVIKEIKSNSEVFKSQEGRDIRVSTIEIILIKKNEIEVVEKNESKQ